MNILDDFKQIRAFVFDVDGVLTDGTVWVFEEEKLIRRMNIKDGYALQLAVKKGLFICVISGGNSPEVKSRLAGLGISDVYMNVKDKKEVLTRFVVSNHLKWEEVLYMGDDIPDWEVMQMVGLPCCPADAVSEIRGISRYVSPQAGGAGCVRDVLEKTMKLSKVWENDIEISSNL
ncbi:MAG: 3-deoxy-D-manno-octulosonate 8-phosphate phosphatase [Ferruginibacter sp.]|nr:3-deoxy-D-manno-octulosonate 8-phosphate phosphatase [Ferruginibacter sp.]